VSAALDVVIFGVVLVAAGAALLVLASAPTSSASKHEREGRPELRSGVTLAALVLVCIGFALTLGACAVAVVASIGAH
jgi:hypothetical protein